MAKQQRCYYCGRAAGQGRSVCRACEDKLVLVRQLKAICTEIRLRAAEEAAARRERENDG